MRPGPIAHQLFAGVGLPGQVLHIGIAAHGNELLALLVAAVPEALQEPEDKKYPAMQAHKALSGPAQAGRIALKQELAHGLRRQATTQHRVIDSLPRGRSHDTAGVAGEQDGAAVVPAFQGLHGDGGALATQGFGRVQAHVFAQGRHRRRRGIRTVCAARADTGAVTVRKHPGVEIRRQTPLVPDIAARRRVIGGAVRRGRLYDLVVSQHALEPIGAGHAVARHAGFGPIGADDRAGQRAAQRATSARALIEALIKERQTHPPVSEIFQRLEGAQVQRGPGVDSPLTQIGIEAFAIHHRHIAIAHGHGHTPIGRRNHARAIDARHELLRRDRKLLYGARRNRPATGLDAKTALQ